MADDDNMKQHPYRRRHADLQQRSAYLKPLWRELNEYVFPWSGRFLFSDQDVDEIRRGENIYNSSTNNIIETAASGLHGGLTSPSRPWFELTHPDRDAMEAGAVKAWVYNLQENKRRVLAQSNFYARVQQLYYEALAYGQGVMLCERDWTRVVRYRTLTCGEYHLAAGPDLSINTVYRRLSMTAEQMRSEFGEKNLSNTVREHLRNKRLDEKIYIIHAIQPWGTFDGKSHRQWKYESVYFEETGDDQDVILARRGYRVQPFVAVRWGQVNGDDVYGYGPGQKSLPDIRQLQTQERAYTNLVEKLADPTMLVPPEFKNRVARGDIRPGALVAASATEAQHLFRPLVSLPFNPLNDLREKNRETIDRIREAFYNPLFLAVNSRERQMTATEVAELVEEKAMVLGPVLEAFQSEIFDPVLDRLYDVMTNEFGMVPPPPEEIRGANLKIEYISLLAQAQKIAGISNLNHFLAIAGSVIQMNQESADKVNFDAVIEAVSAASPVNPSIIRSDDEVEGLRRSRAEQMRQEQTAAAIPGLAGAARDLAQAEPAPDNGLGMLMGAGGAA